MNLDNLKLKNNYVLCELTEKTNEYKTKSGIYLMSEFLNQDQLKYNNLNRMFNVIKVPEKLNCHRWKTDMELLPGDKVWITGTEADNISPLNIDGIIYFMINYFSMLAAKRGDEVIPLNGHIMCEEIFEEEKVLLHSVKKKTLTKAKVLHIGNPNKYYITGNKKRKIECDTNIKEGDIIIKDPLKHVMLEGDKILRFDDKPIIVIQKRYIDAIVA